jgi:hypothetical protein
LIVELPLEGKALIPHDLATHDADIRHIEHERGDGVLGGAEMIGEFYVRLKLLEGAFKITGERRVGEVI